MIFYIKIKIYLRLFTVRQVENSSTLLLITDDAVLTSEKSFDLIASSKISQIVSLNVVRSCWTLRDKPWNKRRDANFNDKLGER